MFALLSEYDLRYSWFPDLSTKIFSFVEQIFEFNDLIDRNQVRFKKENYVTWWTPRGDLILKFTL